jgi:acyl-coenzyme A thioesterase PaaI-like protein
MATLALRVDFLRPATPGQTITAQAHCFKVAGSTAFVRAFAHDQDTTDPVAAAQGTFALADE